MIYYLKRLYQLGPKGSWYTLKRRLKATLFAYKHRPFTTEGQLSFYRTIVIRVAANDCCEVMHDDIRLQWESGRLQELSRLGIAFQETGDLSFVQQFEQTVMLWVEQYPYLFGIHWVCPMEVALRAINLLTAYDQFPENRFSPEFCMYFQQVLRQHADYLYAHDEWSDKPNNHYLAGLVGYLYLCVHFEYEIFFKKQRDITIQRLLKQWQHQLNHDGTSYEGSTAYHRLDTELMYLFIELCVDRGIPLPEWIHNQYAKMLQFLADACDAQGNLAKIGDDDSGFVTEASRDQVAASYQRLAAQLLPKDLYVVSYQQFGLSIIKYRDWHITFRHSTYDRPQPSGHFHQDALAITLSIAGKQIFVDPGSYIYTGNGAWRNIFRSWQSHTTFTSRPAWQQLQGSELFQLCRQEQAWTGVVQQHDLGVTIEDWYILDDKIYRRYIHFDTQKELLTIEDSAQEESTWNFLLHPDCSVQQQDNYKANITAPLRKVVLESSIMLHKTDGYYAPIYGVKQATTCLSGHGAGAVYRIYLNRA